jgi:DNA-binding response OmpR family regulator
MLKGNGEKILLEEDNPSILTIIQDILTILYYQIIYAENGRVTLQIYQRYNRDIALVLSDKDTILISR